MPILEIFGMMLFPDCLNSIVVQFMALILQTMNTFVYHRIKCLKHSKITIYYAYLDSLITVS